ncbi:uncharacterized protein UDID_18128 [Ustilago sp. UG-2017a]|nr:uncharacterized protein UDID_18128 [Ustilago sp. UG-2017a]
MVAKFCVYRQKESFVNPEQKQYLSTTCTSWRRIKTIYRHLTHKWIDYNIALEASALITEGSIHNSKPKPVAHYHDLVTFITDGVFGNHLLLHCPCEQLQFAAHHLIVSYCVARPGEVALTVLATNALKYCNLEFYLMLWDNNDDDEQADDDNELMEDDGSMLFDELIPTCTRLNPFMTMVVQPAVMGGDAQKLEDLGGDAQKLEDPSSSYEGSAGAKGSGGVWDLKQSSLRSVIVPTL